MLQDFHNHPSKMGHFGAFLRALRPVLLAFIFFGALAACSGSENTPRLDRKTLNEADRVLDDLARTELKLSPQTTSLLGLGPLVDNANLPALDDQSQAGFERARLIRLNLLTLLKRRPVMPAGHPIARDLRVLAHEVERITTFQSIGHGQIAPSTAQPYVIDPYSSALFEVPYILLFEHPISSTTEAEAWLSRLAAFGPALDDIRRRLDADTGIGRTPPHTLIAATMSAMDRQRINLNEFDEFKTAFSNMVLGSPDIDAQAADKLISEAQNIVETSLKPAYRKLYNGLAGYDDISPKLPGLQSQPDGFQTWQSFLKWYELPREAADVTLVELAINDINYWTNELANIQSLAANFALDQIDEGAPPQEDLNQASTLAESAVDWVGLSSTVRETPFAKNELYGWSLWAESADQRRPQLILLNSHILSLWPSDLKFGMRDWMQSDAFSLAARSYYDVGNRTPARLIYKNPAFETAWPTYALRKTYDANKADITSEKTELLQALARLNRLVACLSVIDVQIHEARWTLAQAREFIDEHASVDPPLRDHFIAFIIANPGQASAMFYGQIRLSNLETRARAVLDRRYDQSDFETVLFTDGSRPFFMVEADIENWYSAQIDD